MSVVTLPFKASEPPHDQMRQSSELAGKSGQEIEAYAFIQEASLFASKGMHREAKQKAQDALSKSPRGLSSLRFSIDWQDAHPEADPAILSSIIIEEAKLFEAFLSHMRDEVKSVVNGISTSERTERFFGALSKVLDSHGFTPPFTAGTGQDSYVTFSSRPRLQSLGKAPLYFREILELRMAAPVNGTAEIEFVPYAWVASSYARLGWYEQFRLGIAAEAAEMVKEMQSELEGDGK